MNRLRKTLDRRREGRGEEGQSLLETAVTMPLLLSIAFNLINVAYFWFVLLTLSAASRQGVQYATQGGPAASTISAPTTASVSDLVYANVTNAIKGTSTSNVAVRVCSSAKGVNPATGVALCDSFGPASRFPHLTPIPSRRSTCSIAWMWAIPSRPLFRGARSAYCCPPTCNSSDTRP
jgi:Flp pilus assembly protein TadG